jgi:hypothetical protein
MQEMKENEQNIEHIENKKASRFGEKLFSKQKPNTIIKKNVFKKRIRFKAYSELNYVFRKKLLLKA